MRTITGCIRETIYVFYELKIKTNLDVSFQTWDFKGLFQVFILILLHFQDGGEKIG